MPNMPDDVFERISVQAKMPQFLEDAVRDWVRQYTAPMSDVEFLSLRKSWSGSKDLLMSHHADSPEAQSARDLLTVMMWATNPRWHSLYPYEQPSVGDIIAENEALKARVKELEEQLAQVSSPSPYEVEAPKGSTVYTVSVTASPMPVKFAGLPDDRQLMQDLFDAEREGRLEDVKQYIKRKAEEKRLADEAIKRAYADDRQVFHRDLINQSKDEADKVRPRASRIVDGDNKTPFEHGFTRKLMEQQIYDLLEKVDALERQLERVTAEAQSHLQKAIAGDWLTFAEYQHRARETAVYKDSIFEALNITPDESQLARLLKLTYTVMGLAGEVGEFANIVKKIQRDGKTIDEMLNQLVDELGDVVWYVFACADEIGIPLEDIARHNLEKLAKRKAQKQLHDNGNR